MKTKDKIEKSNEINLRIFLYTFAQDKKIFKNARRIVEYLISQGALEDFQEVSYRDFLKQGGISISSSMLSLKQLNQQGILKVRKKGMYLSYAINKDCSKKNLDYTEIRVSNQLYYDKLKKLLLKSFMHKDLTLTGRQLLEFFCATGSFDKFIDFPMPKQCCAILKMERSCFFEARNQLAAQKFIAVDSSLQYQKIKLIKLS